MYANTKFLPYFLGDTIVKDLAILLSDIIFILDDLFTKWAVFGEESVIL
jgi:hypothetical protein